MLIDWETLFTQASPAWKDESSFQNSIKATTLNELKHFLDLTHIKYCLVKPFCELLDYPVVETRELLPSFETDMWEYKQLPGFSLVAFERPIDYFSEIFQFDILHPIPDSLRADLAQATIQKNNATFQSRLPRIQQEHFRQSFPKEDLTDLSLYPQLMPYLNQMDRAQVLGMFGTNSQDMRFYLSGIYGSFPSDLDTEVKRYGLRIGKFSLDHPETYEENRLFVCQYLMELYGFPFSSERRTSAAIFSRKLHKLGEKFLIRVMSQSDRTITTIWSNGNNHIYPFVEKIALVSIDNDYEQLEELHNHGFLIDDKKNVVILRVTYRQHKFSADNVRQERALSVQHQEIIHPLTAAVFNGPSIIRDSTNMVLRLNDIVKGEHSGRIVYKRMEVVENTQTLENQLKFLYSWLSKHQRRMIGYSDDFFSGISKVMNTYLYSQDANEHFANHKELYNEVVMRYNYILQARKIQTLEDLFERNIRGVKISYSQMLAGAVEELHSLKFEIVSYFDSLVTTAIAIGESMLNDRYLIKNYIEKEESKLTERGIELRKNYGKLVSLIDELKSIKKTRNENFLTT